MNAMDISARLCQLSEITSLRNLYREEMNCQIIHDSIHQRAGWSKEYALELAGKTVAYGSVAIAGPWREAHALYEFYVQPDHRLRTFDLFSSLLNVCGAKIIETQSNDRFLTTMLHSFATDVRAESILFEDAFQTSYRPADAAFRAAKTDDIEALKRYELDDGAGWVTTIHDQVVGAGDVLYHYNRPFGDIYMKIAEPFRRRGLGSYLVQELKAVCRMDAGVPAARCGISNLSSRQTLQKAGFIPCGNLIVGDLPVG
jgi:GNAT superfamily N-acetyltransferase